MSIRKLALGALIAVAALGAGATTAPGASNQRALFVDLGVLGNPAPTLQTLRLLGADELRVFMIWQNIAPSPRSRHRPSHFHAADPAAYPDAVWAQWDNVVQQAGAAGIEVSLDLAGGVPRWAQGPGVPTDQPHPSWEPDPVQYGAFVAAVATRYSGDYNPRTHRLDPGNQADLPAVRSWSVWNEPNYGPSLSPQGLPGHLTIEHSPFVYRRLLDAAWGSLMQTGHRRDTILFGEVAPRGFPANGTPRNYSWGVFSGMKPLTFLLALYCVGSDWHPLKGAAASIRGCPSTASGTRSFRGAHPALFSASGFADHPYSRWYPPNVEASPDPGYSSLAQIGQLEGGLDRLQRVYGSHRRFPIWNTEYGYITSPPRHPTSKLPYVSPGLAAAYINQAEYISWKDPRIASFAQYLLGDPLPATPANSFGGFASGLVSYNGRPKVTYSAYRLPLYLPHTTFRRGARLEVWGCARPAFFALTEVPNEKQSVQIQFAPGRSSSFSTLRTVNVSNPHGYFDTSVAFPRSGSVRLLYRYPVGDPNLPSDYSVYSRHVAVSAR